MKQCKRIVVILLAFVVMLSFSITTDAASKKAAKYTVSIDKPEYTIKAGKTGSIKVKLNKAAKKKGVTYTSSNKKIATVNSKGKIKAIKNGKATISVKVNGTKVVAKCKVTVGTPVTKVKFNNTSLSLKVGESKSVKPEISPKKASNKKLIYSSDNAKVAKVDSKGKVTAAAVGSAKITAKATDGSGKKATYTVNVKSGLPTGISIDKNKTALIIGSTAQLKATVVPADADNKTVTWKSSDNNIATVSSNGEVKAVGEGEVIIRATTCNGISATCTVLVSVKSDVSNEIELGAALTSKNVTNIKYTSNASGTITIPAGNYTSKTITFNTPNATIVNNGTFKQVVIQAIAENTFIENSLNKIEFNANKGHIIIGTNGNASIMLNGSANQQLNLENNGNITALTIPHKVQLSVSGDSYRSIPVSLTSNAQGTYIKTSRELNIQASVSWDMAVLPGAEATRASVDNENCLPFVTGVGVVPVTVAETELVNVPAEVDDSLGIGQTVQADGKVNAYDVAEEETVMSDVSDADVYLLTYKASNSDINTENYTGHIENAKHTTTTDGKYVFEDITIGNYWLIVAKDGYCPSISNIIITSNNSDVYTIEDVSILSDAIMDQSAVSISGQVIDGLTGSAAEESGLIVKIRKGSGNILGGALAEVATDGYGTYTFSDVEPGIYTIEVSDLRSNVSSSEIRFNSAYITVVIAGDLLKTTGLDCVVTEQMKNIEGQGQVQYTLTWGDEMSGASSDIDSHLIGPTVGGNGEFHVYYSNEAYDLNDVIYADLDVDDTDYEGPEHTTIYQEVPGVYRFYIHNYSERGASGDMSMMAKSSIKVRITIGTTTVEYNCPNVNGNLWYVCDYNSVTHTIIPVNKMMVFYDDEDEIGLSEEEVHARVLQREKESAQEYLNEYIDTLGIFKDNAAKQTLSNQLNEWRQTINNSDSIEEIHALSDVINQENEKVLEYVQGNIVCSSPKLLNSPYERIGMAIDEDDEEYSYVYMQCEFIDQIPSEMKFAVNENKEGISSLIAEKTSDVGKPYIVHVSLMNGLEYDVVVIARAGELQAELQNTCNDTRCMLNMFEADSPYIAELTTRLNAAESEIATIQTSEQYDAVYEEIDDIYDEICAQVSCMNNAFGFEWDEYYRNYKGIYNEDDELVGYRAVCCFEDCNREGANIAFKSFRICADEDDYDYGRYEKTSETYDEENMIQTFIITDKTNNVSLKYFVTFCEYSDDDDECLD